MPGLLTSAPPFPSDVPVAPLRVIDYAMLKDGDQGEIHKLFLAATELGFWYLKNHGTEEEARGLFDVFSDTLDLPLSEKMVYEQGDSGNSFGYKAKGKIVTDMNGTLDCSEFFNVAQDDALSWPAVIHRTYPEPITKGMRTVVTPFVRKSRDINFTLLSIFEDKLGLARGDLVRLHSPDETCGGEARCVKTPPNAQQAGIGAHSDFGTLSIVHNRLGGLQVMPPGTTEWLYIKPLPRHIVCNVGDALAIFSGGILRSSVHRVMPPPGDQARFARFSVAFFTRPGDHVPLRHLADKSRIIASSVARAPEGQYEPGTTASEWTSRRIRTLRLKSRAGWLASQGTEHCAVNA
ncbi:Clavaminate synthase-like protein [Cristinia sonorae]|uniref:Clavaminate synthase-like protein n=1 Tax=Cristinia sonorae TaxID=1940300 RepID=A0A8K0UKB6_9AGAR|nr:Clavaminate synthase-like protein [Cristinia sonorae]